VFQSTGNKLAASLQRIVLAIFYNVLWKIWNDWFMSTTRSVMITTPMFLFDLVIGAL